MLIELNVATRRRLLQNGYHLALEWRAGAEHKWPDDPPDEKNRLVLVPSDSRYAEGWFISSTRAITIGRELPGGNMGERYGIVCAEDDRGRSQFVLGGGKVQPDFNDGNADRLFELDPKIFPKDSKDINEENRELVRGAVVAENREELDIRFAEKDPDAYKNYFLFGVRGITDRIPDPITGRTETSLKKEDGLSVGDACFLAITHERLGNFEGQKGETRTRHVKSASELLRELSREERAQGVLPMLPYAQATALAVAIVVAKEMFGREAPPALQEIIADGEEAASHVAQRSSYARYFSKILQEGPWEA